MSSNKRQRIGPDGLSSAEIMNIIHEIRAFEGSPKDRTETFERKYPDFAKHYNHLFDMACQTTFDMEKLEYMIAMRDRVRAGGVSVEDASKEVGQKFFDIYVKPKIDELDKKKEKN
jgi:hypothetical protein